jgi:uncharacterized membrane protein
MSSEAVVVAVVTIRVLFLALFSGAYLWLTTAFNSGAGLLPPPQRLELTVRVMKRFLVFSWIFAIAMSIGGLGSAFVVGAQNLGTAGSLSGILALLPTPEGIILVLEVVVTLLILGCMMAIQFVFLPRAGGSKISVSESSDKSLKWLTANDSERALKAVSSISWLSVANIVLGILAIAIGVVYSSL